ncbi:UNVERIFIED_CONTAM: hypothetical protein Sradi_3296200 [Sesamum radiatum]|uniref:Uncharacterized protein n=1 Tax=Sesamum radiatum TaxID=300843 RepID=A0AAW2R0G0_SESRA
MSSTEDLRLQGRVGEVHGDPLQSHKCYIEDVQKGRKMSSNDISKKEPPSKGGKDLVLVEEAKDERETPVKVQPAEKLLFIEFIPRNLEKTARMGSQMEDMIWEEVIRCL